MSAVTTTRPAIPAGPWTVDDLDDFPEGDTRRYELIDGALLVSAEPSHRPQLSARRPARLTRSASCRHGRRRGAP